MKGNGNVLLFQFSTRHRLGSGGLQTVVSESMVPRETLESQGRGYIAFPRSHMDKEEDQAFPLASKVLREQDWAEIDTAMASKAHPVFGKVVAGKYRALYDFLTQQSA